MSLKRAKEFMSNRLRLVLRPDGRYEVVLVEVEGESLLFAGSDPWQLRRWVQAFEKAKEQHNAKE